jgi:hypothetical protein
MGLFDKIKKKLSKEPDQQEEQEGMSWSVNPLYQGNGNPDDQEDMNWSVNPLFTGKGKAPEEQTEEPAKEQPKEGPAEDESDTDEDVEPQVPDNPGVMSLEDFKKATYVMAAKRGEFLSKIDFALKQYDDFLETDTGDKGPGGETGAAERKLVEVRKLETIEVACAEWLKRHPDPKITISVKRRRPVILKLNKAAEDEKKERIEEVQEKRPESTAEEFLAQGDLDTAYTGEGLMPYKYFVKKIDDIKKFYIKSASKDMEKRRSEGKDVYIIKLLKAYEEYESTVGGNSDANKMSNKDTVKTVTEFKMTKLLNLEKSCNDWLSANKSKAGILYMIKSGFKETAKARRVLIGGLVATGGAIDHEKKILKANFGALADVASKEKGDGKGPEKSDFSNVTHEVANEIFGYEEFKKMTYAGKTSKRGDNLTKIDELIKQYHEQKKSARRAKGSAEEAKKESELLQKIYTAATFWLNLHANDSGGSVQFRLPVIRDLAEIAQKKLKNQGVDTEKIDAGKNSTAVLEYKGVTLNQRKLPTLEEWLKLTYVSLTNKREKYLKEIDAALENYHKSVDGNKEDDIKQLLTTMLVKTRMLEGVYKDNQKEEYSNRIAAVANLEKQIVLMMEESKKPPEEAEESGAVQGEASFKPKNRRALPTVGEFKKITYAGKIATRGDYLTKIDKLLFQYDVYRIKDTYTESEQEKVLGILKNLMRACLVWSQRHDNQADGGSVGSRRLFIDKMTMKDGLIAEEIKLMLADKILTGPDPISDVFKVKDNADNFSSIFKTISEKFAGKYGNEKKHFKIGGYVSVNAPFVPMTSARVNIFYEYDGEKNSDLDKPDMEPSDDNMRTKLSSEHKLGFGISAKLLFFLTGNAETKIGAYTQAKAKNPEQCAKLTKFCTYNKFRRSYLVPAWLTNKIYGGSVHKDGYTKAEAEQSGAVKVLAEDGRNYVEEGATVGAEADVGAKLASAKASSDTRFHRRRITRDVVKKALESSGGVDGLSYENLDKAYMEQSEGGTSENKASRIHRAVHEGREKKDSSRKTRLQTKLVKKGSKIWDYKDGKLVRFKIVKGFDVESFIAGSSAQNSVMDMLRTLQDKFGAENEDGKADAATDQFDIMELNLQSFKDSFAKKIEDHKPLQQLCKLPTPIRLGLGKDANISLELDMVKNTIKLYINKIDIDSTLLAMPLTMAAKHKVYEVKDVLEGFRDTMTNVQDFASDAAGSSFGVSAGLNLEFNSSAEELLGLWPLKKSSFSVAN